MKITLILLLSLVALPALAGIKTQNVEYKEGDTALEGFLAWDDAKKGKLPGVLVVHDWMGMSDYVKGRAKELAAMGYVAFAPDIYGKAGQPKNAEEAGAQAAKYKKDVPLMRKRVQAGFEVLKKHARVDPAKLIAQGYCFGGTTALELARSGAELAGTICFHCSLNTPDPADAKNIKGKVLALQGGDDPFVPPAETAAFQDEMRKAGVDWQLVQYGGAVHAYTVPGAGNDPSKGAAYNAKADKRSLAEAKRFYAEIFGGK